MKATFKKENIFWHEIGHYCAQQLNKKYYEKFGCQGIEIIGVGQNGLTRYKGGATPNKPPGYDPTSKKINHPASTLGSLVYGCIFQSCYLNEPFSYCFEKEEHEANGFNDYNGFWGIAERFFLSPLEKDKLDALVLDQIAIVKASITQSGIFSIDITTLISKEEERTWIPAEELDKKFTDFLVQHGPLYKTFVDKIDKLFEGKRQYEYKGAGN